MRDELKKANDPVPLESVGIADAFDTVLDQAHEEADFLNRIEDPAWVEWLNFERKASSDQPHPHDGIWAKEDAANVFFRKQLTQRSLTACVLDPRTGLTLKLGAGGWLPKVKDAWRMEPFRDNYIDVDEGVFGPEGALIQGQARPVFFMASAFQIWFHSTFPFVVRVGRPPGAGSYRIDDEPLISKMKELIEAAPSLGIPRAALQCAEEAKGAGTLESRAKRLERRYVGKFRPQRSF